MVIRLSFEESGRYVALIVVKGLLQHISHHDRVLPSGKTSSFRLLGLRRARFDLEAISLLPDSVYKEDGESSSTRCANELLLTMELRFLPQNTSKGT